jgi:arabinose-5-phosphate isomerase
MSEGRLGMVIVGTADDFEGIITDGDLRRALLNNSNIAELYLPAMMTTTPVIISEDELVSQAENLMLVKKITTILVGDESKRQITGVYQIFN